MKCPSLKHKGPLGLDTSHLMEHTISDILAHLPLGWGFSFLHLGVDLISLTFSESFFPRGLVGPSSSWSPSS